MAKKAAFTASLRATSIILEPLIKGSPEPYALAWWSKLQSIAAMIETQGSDVTAAQISYLKKELFGGMGSLNDLWFDMPGINENLSRAREKLFCDLSALESY
jgi:hypothetical protein